MKNKGLISKIQESVKQIINCKRKGTLIPTFGNYHVKFNVLHKTQAFTLVRAKGSS